MEVEYEEIYRGGLDFLWGFSAGALKETARLFIICACTYPRFQSARHPSLMILRFSESSAVPVDGEDSWEFRFGGTLTACNANDTVTEVRRVLRPFSLEAK